MKLKSEYPFRYIVTYIPSYYCNLEDWQVANQQAVYNFKKGIISDEHKRKILETVNSIVKDRWDEWAICFIPASSRKKDSGQVLGSRGISYCQRQMSGPTGCNRLHVQAGTVTCQRKRRQSQRLCMGCRRAEFSKQECNPHR